VTRRSVGPRMLGVSLERGSVTIVAAAVIALGLVITIGAADVGHALIARSRARTAADAAALAAAQELALPSGRQPGEVAAEYAEHNGAVLTACACDPETFEATVEVRIDVGGFLLVSGSRTVTARARAVVDLPTSGPEP
jgi:secretion/DNA translocation related TadE-like protein